MPSVSVMKENEGNEVSTLFWDVGGVLLTNGWDTESRQQASRKFQLDWQEFQERHELISADFEKGGLSLDEYLERTVFYCRRAFSKQDFKNFMYGRSQPLEGSLELLGELKATGTYFLATLNNESRELNRYRIDHFGLNGYFSVFFSSCYLGVKKPDAAIYLLALQVTQKPPQECLYIDDRALNLESASRLGMKTIQFENAGQLRRQLKEAGVRWKEPDAAG